jgi:hypothetical protein
MPLTRRRLVLLTAFALLAALPPAARSVAAKDGDKAPPEPPPPRDARETVAAYLDAALNGRVEEATGMGVPGSSPSQPGSVKDFAELKIKALALKSVRADDTGALAITEDVAGDHDRKGPLVLTLVKRKGQWLVNDIDLEDEKGLKDEEERFLEQHPHAREVPEKKQEGSKDEGTE